MTGSDQISKLKERNEQLQKQLEGSRKKVSDLEAQLKRTRLPPPPPPPPPKDSTGPDKDTEELEKKLQELNKKLAKQNQEFERSMGKLQKELTAARGERDELAKQLRTLREKLVKSASSPSKDSTGPDKDTGELEKKLQELNKKLAKQNQEFERSMDKLQKELTAARAERDEFANQLRTLREKPVTSASSPSGGEGNKEPEYDPETQKYKFSWMGDSQKDIGKKGPPAAKKQESAGLDRRTTEEKMAAMATEKQAPEKGKPAQKVEEKAEPEGEQKKKEKKDEEELEETASYSVEELLEKADLEDSDVAVVTSESGGRPVLRMHEVPDGKVAKPTLQDLEESPVTESREGEVTDKEVKQAFSDDDFDVITEEKMMGEVSPAVYKTLFARFIKELSNHRALVLKSLFFLVGAGLGVGLALLIFLGPDTKEPGREEGAGAAEEVIEEPAEAPEEEKTGKAGEVTPDKKDVIADTAKPEADRAPAELVEAIYQDAAIMDKKAAVKVGAALRVLIGKYPKDPLLRYHYARALYLKGDVDTAVVQLEESRKLDPDLTEVHYLLGSIYLRMGDEKKAHEALNNFTQLTGKNQ